MRISMSRAVPRRLFARSEVVFFMLACAALAGTARAASGQLPADATETPWAILIGVEKYRIAPPLEYTTNDVDQLTETLRDRGGYEVAKLAENALTPEWQPTRANIFAKLPELLGQLGSAQSVVLYFTGHGGRDANGKLYLAPIDCDPKRLAETGIGLEWLREQLTKCKAHQKLLILDACHAGSARSAGQADAIASKDLTVVFDDVQNLATLASCSGGEKSVVWVAKQQSLFSYWLNQGLRGHADLDANRSVTIFELQEYLSRNVPLIAETRFQRRQTPVLHATGITTAVDVIRPLPFTLKGLLDDMAEKLATAAQIRNLATLGVPELAVDAKSTELALGVDFGILGRYCAAELTGRLADRSGGQFDVVAQEALQAALHARGLTASSARSAAIKDLTVEGQPVVALAEGKLCSREGHVITLQCELRKTGVQTVLGSAGGTALLNDSEWAMLGRSAQVKPEDRPTTTSATQASQQVIERLDDRSNGPHPLADENYPYRVCVMVKSEQSGWEERTATFQGNEMLVSLKRDEVYSVWVKNTSSEPVMMPLLVDGLSTLPEPVPTKDISVERKQRKHEWLPAQRVNLTEASAWKLEPAKEYAILGFYSETGDEGQEAKFREFKVVDAPQSAAARQSFTDQLGLITAAFYAPKSKPKGAKGQIGTGFGREYAINVDQYDDVMPGVFLGVVHIRYGE